MNQVESWPLPFGENPIIDLGAGAVALEIVPIHPGETARIELTGGRHSDVPAPEISSVGDTVQIKLAPLSFGWPPWRRGRHGSFRLVVPPNVRARVHCAAGQIRVERLAGCDLELSTGAGQIVLRDVHGRLALEANAGQIRGERVGGTLQIESSLGEVRLEVDSLDPGTHRVHSSMGSVRIELIEGLKVRIDAQTSMGSTRNRYPSTPDADTILSLETDLGSVRVDPAGKSGSARYDANADAEDWRRRWGGQPWAGPCWPAERGGHPFHRPHFNPRHAQGGSWFWAGPSDSTEPPGPRPGTSTPRAGASDDELKRILTLVEQGKINAEQANDLIRALQGR
jgi:hypothetical protein